MTVETHRWSGGEDFLLFIFSVITLYFLYIEYLEHRNEKDHKKRSKRMLVRKKHRAVLHSPIFVGSSVRKMCYFDLLSLNHFVPNNAIVSSADYELTENNINLEAKPVIPDRRPKSMSIANANEASELQVKQKEIYELCTKIQFPFMPGCEPDGTNALQLANKYPELSRADIVRFLVARKGNLKAADEMLEKCLNWRRKSFPLKKADVAAAFGTKCFFPYGQAKDGSPIVYMRGGLYDANIATPEQYVLAAAYTIDYSLKQHPDQVNVTVIVHTVNIPGGPNQSADTNFIKLFIQVLSDNYPERLKRLAIFPFPWYGRAIWGVLKVFVDKRTQDKVMLLSKGGEKGLPPELQDCLDVNQVPEFMGGLCKEPIVDLLDTLEG